MSTIIHQPTLPLLPANITLSTSNGKSLPPELFNHILSILQRTKKLGSLANLQRCSKSHYKAVTPYLYKRLIVNETAFEILFNQLTSFDKREAHLLFTFIEENLSRPCANDPAPIRLRRNLNRVKHLTFISTSRSCGHRSIEKDAHTALSLFNLTTQRLLPNLKTVSLELDDLYPHPFELVKFLDSASRPKYLCLRYHDIAVDEKSEERVTAYEFRETSWLEQYNYIDMPKLILHEMTSDIPCGLVAFQGLRLSFTRSLRCKRNHSGIEHSEQSCCRSYRDDQIESLEDASISNMYGEHDSWQIVARADAEGHQSIAELEKMVKDFKQGSSKYFPWTPRDDDSEEKQYNLKNCLKWCQGLQIVNVEDADPCEACGMPV